MEILPRESTSIKVHSYNPHFAEVERLLKESKMGPTQFFANIIVHALTMNLPRPEPRKEVKRIQFYCPRLAHVELKRRAKAAGITLEALMVAATLDYHKGRKL